MQILVFNCGSSSLKFEVLAVQPGDSGLQRGPAAVSGSIERIGEDGWLKLEVGGAARQSEPCVVADVEAAARRVLSLLQDEGLLTDVDAVGHRIVHGGDHFPEPVLVDDAVIESLEQLNQLAPLHNPPALTALRAAREALPSLPAVACFDTSFFSALPAAAATYAIPREISRKHGIKRFGFHGLAHRSMVERYLELQPSLSAPRIISFQLGNGCSAAACRGVAPVETSMGFTPLEGLIMGTRSGDIDPGLPGLIADREGLSSSQVENLLNRRSGLLGLSGRSRDMRDLLEAAADGDNDAALAVDAFCHRARKYLGAYMAVLGGVDAVLFGGGIGQNSSEIRARICDDFGWAGLNLDSGRNLLPAGSEARISSDASAVDVWVMDVNEALLIARDVVACLQR